MREEMKHRSQKSYMRLFTAVLLMIDKIWKKIPMSTTGRMDKQITTFTKLNTLSQKEEKENSGMCSAWSNLRNATEEAHSVCMKSRIAKASVTEVKAAAAAGRSGEDKNGLKSFPINDENALHLIVNMSL